MSAFRIEPVQQDYFAVLHAGRKVAILFPARPYVHADLWPAQQALPWSVMPDPEAFPDAECKGLPAPLSPWGNRFDSFEQLLAFLDIQPEAIAA